MDTETESQDEYYLSQHEALRVREYLDLWADRLGNPLNKVVHDGDYRITNGSLSYDIHKFSYINATLGREVWLLMATGVNGELVGMEQTFFDQSGQRVKVDGNIEIFERGKGIASALEALNQALIQDRLDNHVDVEEYVYVIDDANLRRVEALTDEVQRQKAVQERKAWESLYGRGGKLGFNEEDGKFVKRYKKGVPKLDLGYKIDEMPIKPINPVSLIRTKLEGI